MVTKSFIISQFRAMVAKNLNTKVLIVDDDEINLEILKRSLKKEGFSSSISVNGQDALETLTQNPSEYDLVLLDKMMPKMNGIEVLMEMRKHPLLRNIPVIMQTGDIGDNEAKEGLAAGAYYYLAKPFDHDMMMAIVNSAVKNIIKRDDNQEATRIKNDNSVVPFIDEAKFTISNADDSLNIATLISKMAQNPEEANVALLELINNAVEHGNLNIGFDAKRNLLLSGTLHEEIERRAALEHNKNKKVYIFVKRIRDDVTVTILDEGQGFKWHEYLHFDSLRLAEPNGRSISIIENILKLDIQYFAPGNKVILTFKSKQSCA